MNRQELIDYSNNNNVIPFHNVVTLDVLKHLSEQELPKEIKQDYYNQYEAAMLSMEPSKNWNLSKLLYDEFEGSGPITIGNTVNSYTHKGIVVSAVEIEIPYFKKMADYLVEHGISRGTEHVRIVLDITINGVSTLQMLLSKPSNGTKYCPFSTPFFTVNDRDYAILNTFGKPYNGIEAMQIPDILKRICEERSSYNSSSNIESYLKMLVSLFSYYINVDSMLADMKVALK